MVNKKKLAATAVATFGAAMTSMYVAPELQADIVDLTFNIESVPFGDNLPVHLVEISASFFQFNGANKTILGQNIEQLGLVQSSQTLSAGTFSADPIIFLTNSASGTAFVGFLFNDNVGWFSLDLGGPMGAVTFLDGEYGSMGESVHVGGTIPEPAGLAGLAMLALGAVGIRRKRKPLP